MKPRRCTPAMLPLVLLALTPGTGARAGVPNHGAAPQSGAGVVRILEARGDVALRRGASVEWVKAASGDALKPEDSMRLAAASSAVIETGGRRIAVPAGVIIDAADLREITRTDLLLKLAMEDVRSAPTTAPSLGNPEVQRTTTTRAGNRDAGPPAAERAAGGSNLLRLAGTSVLYENGYYGTCVLRTREIFRLEPSLAGRTDAWLRLADALERMNVREEAYEAYSAVPAEGLTPAQKSLVEKKREALKP